MPHKNINIFYTAIFNMENPVISTAKTSSLRNQPPEAKT